VTVATQRASGTIAAVAILIAASTASAGPWVKEVGEAFVKVAATAFQTEQGFNQGIATGLAYNAVTYNVYAEVGLPGGLQLVTDVPFVTAVNASPAGVNYRNRTFGDARFELDYALLPDFPLTLGVETKVPLYAPIADQPEVAENYPRSASKFPDAGDGNVDVTPKLLVGWSFHPTPAWATAELGYRARFGEFADGLYWAAGGGIFVVPNHFAIGVYASGVLNLEEDADATRAQTKEYGYAQGYLLLQGLPLDPELGLNLSAGGIFFARNAARGVDFTVGLSHAF
jgi:hypothetical protein